MVWIPTGPVKVLPEGPSGSSAHMSACLPTLREVSCDGGQRSHPARPQSLAVWFVFSSAEMFWKHDITRPLLLVFPAL